MDDVSEHVREAIVTATVVIGESFVIDAEQVEDGGVEVVHVDFVSGDSGSEFVGFAMDDAALCASSRKPG